MILINDLYLMFNNFLLITMILLYILIFIDKILFNYRMSNYKIL